MPRAKKPVGPSLVEVTLGAVLSLMLGALLAAGYLVARPVDTVTTLPKEPDLDKIYYVTGSARSALGRQWLRKQQMLIEGGAAEIRLNEDELNTWMASSEAKPDAEAASGFFVAKSINFRVREGVLQIGLPCTLALPGYSRDVVVQAKGGFAGEDDHFAFEPSSVMIGTLAVHRVPLIGDFIVNRLLASQAYPEDLASAWRTLSSVTIEDDALVLVRR